jgi:hypothetical protein
VLRLGELDPLLPLPPEPPLPLPPLGGLLFAGGGGGVPDVDGGVDGVFGFAGGVDCVGQVALASITDPSGHVFVVGGVVDGAKVWVHEGSVGFFVQSTDGSVPEVQLFSHVNPLPDPPEDGIDVLLEAADEGHVVLSLQLDAGGVIAIPCSFASCMSQSLVFRFISRSVLASASGRSQVG